MSLNHIDSLIDKKRGREGQRVERESNRENSKTDRQRDRDTKKQRQRTLEKNDMYIKGKKIPKED